MFQETPLDNTLEKTKKSSTTRRSSQPAQVFEQSSFSFIPAIKSPPPPEEKPTFKKPFIPPQLQAVDAQELRLNFMYILRILINSANRQPNTPAGQQSFVNALLAELKIKKGMGSIDIETRSAILRNK